VTNLIGLGLLFGAALLQTTLSPYMKIGGIHPDLVLLLVIGWSALRGMEEGATWAFIGGISLDILSSAPFGVFSLSLLLVSVITSLFHGRTLGSTIVLPIILTFPLSLIFNGVALILLSLLGQPTNWVTVVSVVILPAAIYDTALMLVIFPLLYLLNRWLSPRTLTL
jgi:rod shape-determining protein MreD